MSQQVLFANYGPQLLVVDSADFDGANDFMSRTLFAGAADSRSGILSAWIRIDGGDGTVREIFGNSDDSAVASHFSFTITAGDLFQIEGRSGAGSVRLNIRTVATYAASATWLHVLASWDLATVGARSIYVNDTLDVAQVTFINDLIDYAAVADNAQSIGAVGDGDNKFNGCLAEFYFAPGQYLDFSNVFNRRKFISASGKPVWLGVDGSAPTGTAPISYQRVADGAAVATFATNLGTGGDFSITGTLETGSTSPSD